MPISFAKLHLVRGVFYLGIFFVFFVISYKVFRQSHTEIMVELAEVQFKDTIANEVQALGVVRPSQSWPVTVKIGGRLSEILVRPGDVVIKDQTIAVLDQHENRKAVEAALANLKNAKSQQEIEKQREYLRIAKDRLADSMLRAPANGVFSPAKLLDNFLKTGDVVGHVQNLTSLDLLVEVPYGRSKEIAGSVNVTIFLNGGNTLRTSAEVRNNLQKGNVSIIDVSLPPNHDLLADVDRDVRVTFNLSNFYQVALVDESAVIMKDGDKKIVVVSETGLLRYQSVTDAPVFDHRILLEGVDRKTFQVVNPKNIEAVNKAIAMNVIPHIVGAVTKRVQ